MWIALSKSCQSISIRSANSVWTAPKDVFFSWSSFVLSFLLCFGSLSCCIIRIQCSHLCRTPTSWETKNSADLSLFIYLTVNWWLTAVSKSTIVRSLFRRCFLWRSNSKWGSVFIELHCLGSSRFADLLLWIAFGGIISVESLSALRMFTHCCCIVCLKSAWTSFFSLLW